MSIIKGKNILIVDDEPMLREILRDELEYIGAHVQEAENGRNAFNLIQGTHFDAVVTDIRMPGGDGIELLDNIKSIQHDIPVVMLITGFSDLTHDEAYQKGASAIFGKPYDMNKLVHSLERLMLSPEERWSRGEDRVETRIPIHLKLGNFSEMISSHALNIGQGGLFVHLKSTLPEVGSEIEFRLDFSNGESCLVQGHAIVRWVRHQTKDNLPSGMGVEFLHLDEHSRKHIIEYIQTHKPKNYIPKF